jgi:hypothetical protein
MAGITSPVIDPAMAMQIPAELQAETKPASAPVTRAITRLAQACSSTMSTPRLMIAAAASMASARALMPPSVVRVPVRLITGCAPRRTRISALSSSSFLVAIVIPSPIIA